MERRFGEIRKLSDNVDKTRKVEFVISTGDKDRHKTVIDPEGWDLENFNRNGIVGYQHDVYGGMFGGDDPDRVIGKGRAFIEGDKLIGEVEFEPEDINSFAEKIFKKVKFGTLKATSVGFKKIAGHWGDEEKEEHREGKEPTYYYDKQELLEFSIVNIPSNPNAIKRSKPEEQAKLIDFMVREALGENFDEKLTLKGIYNILGLTTGVIDPDNVYLEELNDYDKITNKHEL